MKRPQINTGTVSYWCEETQSYLTPPEHAARLRERQAVKDRRDAQAFRDDAKRPAHLGTLEWLG